MKKLALTFILLLSLTSCVSTELQSVLDQTLGGSTASTGLAQSEIISGLKQALAKGATVGSNLVSKPDGFLKNPLIKLPFPPEAIKLKNTLDSIGLKSLTNKVEISLNHAAEKASEKAAPIFINAIKSMTIKDAMNILMGSQNAATQYLQKTTTAQLKQMFAPIIGTSLNQVHATKYWGEATSRYNMIPFVKPVATNLQSYVTDRALTGLFSMIAKQEMAIRANPIERTTALLKKVFGYAQLNK